MEVTNNAAVELFDIFNSEKECLGKSLRISVSGSFCSQLHYIMGPDNKTDEDTEILLENGVSIIFDKKSQMYLETAVLEWHGGEEGRGFQIRNGTSSFEV